MCSLITQCENIWAKCKTQSAVAYWDDQNCYKTLSFEEVEQICKNITEFFASKITEKYTCVGLYMEHNPFIPSLVISLHKYDSAFIFLDPHVSDKDTLAIIIQLNIKWIISHNHGTYPNFLTKHGTKLGNLGNTSLKLWSIPHVTDNDISFKDICYVVCTSGTTGDTKMVKVEHHCIMSNIVSLRNKFELTSDDVIYFGTALTFDPCMIELFLALTSGCTLLIVPYKVKINSSRLLNVLFPKEGTHKGATVLQIVPSLFLRWSVADIEFILQRTRCRILAFGGEAFPTAILKLDKSEHLRIFNLYGITEFSCWSTIYEVLNKVDDAPLGKPLNDTLVEVRNYDGLTISDGKGELYIGSFSRVSYVNEENESTVVKPLFRSTGDIVRICDQGIFYLYRNHISIIKRFGYRVNLTGIEKRILEKTNLPCTCIWLENKCKLIIFFVIVEFNPITKQKIVDKLQVMLLRTLPKQSYPDYIELLPNFPLTKHGKIDKRSLAEIYNNLTDHLSKKCLKTPHEVFLSLCGKYLGLSCSELHIYDDCNFFELGGNSISAIQFISEFKQLTGTDYSNDLTILFFEKTLRECCDFIRNFKVVAVSKREHSPQAASNRKAQMCEKHGEENSTITLKICWKYNLEACVDSSPTIIKSSTSTRVAVGSFSHTFAILDALSGDVQSRIVLPDTIEGACCISPSSNHIYIGCYDGKMYCINSETGNIIWEYISGDRIKCTPCLCLHNQAIAFGSYDKWVHCINVQSGNLLWKTSVKASIASSPVSYKQQIYIATTFGRCMCLSESNGQIMWKHNVGAPIFGSPCIHAEIIIWPDVNGTLHGFFYANGKKEWTFEVKGNIYSSLVQYEGFIIFGCYDHKIYCVQIADRACFLNYAVSMKAAVSSTPQILQYNQKTYIIAATNDGTIGAIEFSTGKLMANLKIPGEIFSSAAVNDERIYIGCRDNNLYCLSIVCEEVNK